MKLSKYHGCGNDFIMGVFIILIILLETILRFIGLCIKSEKVFKLSLILSEIIDN